MTLVLFVGPLIPRFGLLVILSPLGFNARVGGLIKLGGGMCTLHIP